MVNEILLADDEATFRETFTKLLQKEGMTVTAVANGTDAIKAVRKQPYAVAILDVQMPVLNGLDTLRLLRRSSDRRHLPVIVLSGRGAFEDVCDGWTHGASLYLTKPVKIEAVVSAVRWMLGLDERKGPILSEVVAPDL